MQIARDSGEKTRYTVEEYSTASSR